MADNKTTHTQRWPLSAGVTADYITVCTQGPGANAAQTLRLHGIPHTTTTMFVANAARDLAVALQTISEVRDTLGAGPAESAQARAKDVMAQRASLDAAVTAHSQELDAISSVLGPRRGDESALDQAKRARAILDRWQDIAKQHLPACPQVNNALATADLGTRHFELRGFVGGALRAAAEGDSPWRMWARHWSGLPHDAALATFDDNLREHIATNIEKLEAKVRTLEIAATDSAKREAALTQEKRELSDRLVVAHEDIDRLQSTEASLRTSLKQAEDNKRDAVETLGKVRTALKCPDGAKISEHAAAVMLSLELYKNGADAARANDAVSRDTLASVRSALKCPQGTSLAFYAAEVLAEAKEAKHWKAEAARLQALVASSESMEWKGGPDATVEVRGDRIAVAFPSPDGVHAHVYTHTVSEALALRRNLGAALAEFGSLKSVPRETLTYKVDLDMSAAKAAIAEITAAAKEAQESIDSVKIAAAPVIAGASLQRTLQNVMPAGYTLDVDADHLSPWYWRSPKAVSHRYSDAFQCVQAAWAESTAGKPTQSSRWSGFIFADGSVAECPDLEVTAGDITGKFATLYSAYAPHAAYKGLTWARSCGALAVRVMIKGQMSATFACTSFTCDQYAGDKARIYVSLER